MRSESIALAGAWAVFVLANLFEYPQDMKLVLMLMFSILLASHILCYLTLHGINELQKERIKLCDKMIEKLQKSQNSKDDFNFSDEEIDEILKEFPLHGETSIDIDKLCDDISSGNYDKTKNYTKRK